MTWRFAVKHLLLTLPQGAWFTVESIRVGELVKRSGSSRKALRLYEARGILPTPRRTASGYRIYGDEVLTLLSPSSVEGSV